MTITRKTLALIFLLFLTFVSLSFMPSQKFVYSSVFTEDMSFNNAFSPHDSIKIENNTAFLSYGFPGTGSTEDPFIIEGLNITGDPLENPYPYEAPFEDGTGIRIVYTNFSFIIRDCYISRWRCGISISRTSNFSISNNIIKYGSTSIGILDCTYFTLSNNICTDNIGNGINIEGITLPCSNFFIVNNTCFNSEYGIRAYLNHTAVFDSNKIYRCTALGIVVYGYSGGNYINITNNHISNCKDGINLVEVHHSFIKNNTCIDNTKGIVSSSSFCSFSYNTLFYNSFYGIDITPHSFNNSLHHNSFIENLADATSTTSTFYSYTSQAHDIGYNNTWYDTETNLGNYWSDYSGRGSYLIDGKANSSDPYPLNKDLLLFESSFPFWIPISVIIPILLISLIYTVFRLKRKF